MVTKKAFGAIWLIAVATALGHLPANAQLNLNSGGGAVTYAKETLTATTAVSGTTYYTLTSDTSQNQRLSFDAQVGRAVSAGGVINVRFTLTDMVFVGGTAPTLAVTGKANATASLTSGGSSGDATVAFNLTAGASEALAASDVMRLTVTSLGVRMDAVGQVKVETGTGGTYDSETPPVRAHTVAGGLRETATPGSPVVRLGDSYRTFAGELVASVGRIDIGLPEGATLYNAADSQPVVLLASLMSPTASENTVTFAGDLAFVEDAFLSAEADCSTKDEEGILGGNGAWAAVNLEDANERHLCLEVDGVTSIPETDFYSASVDYTGVTGALFPPADVPRLTLGRVTRGGFTVRFPFVNTNPRFVVRFVITNRGSEPAPYRFGFTPPEEATAVPGPRAAGTVPANSVLFLNAATDVVTVTGGGRTSTAASLTVDASPEMIDILSIQINRRDGSTDTVRYNIPGS